MNNQITNINDQYSETDILVSKFAKALSHPARVRILKFLASQQDCFCGNIVDYLPLSQSTVSQHLKELKEAGLIHGIYRAPKVFYCINQENWILVKSLFNEMLSIDINNICNKE